MSSSQHRSSDQWEIPAERRAIEGRLIQALETPKPKRVPALLLTLQGFSWPEHRELACLGLAEITRALERKMERRALARRGAIQGWCGRCAGSYCRRCPVTAARL